MTADRGGGRPFCRRCLLEAVPDAEALRATMRAWRAAIPPEQRADEGLYARRLERCQACDYLADGTCALCGCYVELRAAKAPLHCPDVPRRW